MDHTNANTALASALVEEFARCGMRTAVICPGSRSAPLALAFDRNPAIETKVAIDERSAGFFALGIALGSGAPVGVITTSGSAVANLLPAVVEADHAAVPIILITADRPPELRDTGAGQTIDQDRIFGNSVRWFSDLGVQSADDVGLLHFRSSACRAWTAAGGDPRSGPVHLNVPFREPLAPSADPDSVVTAAGEAALGARGPGSLLRVLKGKPQLDRAMISDMAARIASAERPLLIAGSIRNGESVTAPITRFAQSVGCPVLAEPTSQLRWGRQDRSTLISNYDLIARAAPATLEPDLILRVGDPVTSKPLRGWLTSSGEIEQIVVDPDGAWKEPSRTADLLVRAEIASLFDDLTQQLSVLPAREGWLRAWSESDGDVAGIVRATLDELDGISEPGIWPLVARSLVDGDRVLAASSMPVRDMEAFLPAGEAEVRFFANRGANGIDGQISTAAGLSEGCLGTTFAVIGDLAFAHDLGSLRLLTDSPRLRMIVIDNSGGGIFDFLPVADAVSAQEMDRLFTTPSGLRPAELARSLGLTVTEPTSPQDFMDALAGDSNLIHVTTDRSDNVGLHRDIAAKVSAALIS